MFKLVVLSALVAVAMAKPSGLLYSAAPVVAAPAVVAKTVVAPAAVSSTYREDVVSKPAVVAYSAPVLAPAHLAYAAAPAVVPALARSVVASAPLAYAAPAHLAYAAPAVHPW